MYQAFPVNDPVNEIIQQLDSLSLGQLLELKEKVDALISSKSKTVKYEFPFKSETRVIFGDPRVRILGYQIIGETQKLDIEQVKNFLKMLPLEEEVPGIIESPSIQEEVGAEDGSLDFAIKLMEEWMADESGYDEETYPQIEAALNQNQLSL